MKFAILNGNIVTADKVARGLSCGCICEECGGKVVACKGEIKTPYFSHYDLTECEGSDMTLLHRIAENRYRIGNQIYIPELKYKNEIIEDSKWGIITDIKVEEDFGEVKPDIILTIDSVEYFFEIMVTHKVDSIKRSKLNKLGYPVIEIYLDELYKEWEYTKDLTFDFYKELDNILYNNTQYKKWCYHKYVYKRQIEDDLAQKKLEEEKIQKYKEFLLSIRHCPECENRIYPPIIGETIIKCDQCNYQIDRNELIKNPKMKPMWDYNGWELKLMKEGNK